MSSTSISVRRATLEDRPAVFDFIRQAYPHRWQYKIPDRWQWVYIDNPYLAPGELPLWIAVEGQGTVVGQTGALVEPLVVGGKDYRVGWSIDTFLLPAYRGQGLGRLLQQANDEANPIFMSLSMSEANRRIKTSLGSTPLDPVATYVKSLRHLPDRSLDEVLDRLKLPPGAVRGRFAGLFRSLKFDRFLARLLTARAALRNEREFARIDRSVQVEPVDKFTPEFSRLWEMISPDYRVSVRRDSAYLKWKYTDQPHTDYRRLVARRDGEICGYLILRRGRAPEPNRGILTDLFARPGDRAAIHALLGAGVAWLAGEGVESISTATNLPPYQAELENFGFRETKPATPMIHCRAAPEACAAIHAPGAWLLGKGDHDWDQFPLG